MKNAPDDKILTRSFGNRCRQLRNDIGESQMEFSESICMDRSYYASIETGVRNVTLQSMAKIAMGFDMPLSELLWGVEYFGPYV